MANPTEFWVTYFTSSKEIKNLIALHGKELFSVQIRKIFKTRKDTVAWEHKFLTRINAAKSPYWLNKNNGGNKFHATEDSIAKTAITRKAKCLYEKTLIAEKKKATEAARSAEENYTIKEKQRLAKTSRTPAERLLVNAKKKATEDAKSPEEKLATKEKQRLAKINRTSEEKLETKQKEWKTKNARSPEEKQTQIEKQKTTLKATIEAKPLEEKLDIIAKRKATFDAKTPEEKLVITLKLKNSHAARTPEQENERKRKEKQTKSGRTAEQKLQSRLKYKETYNRNHPK